LIQVTYLPDGVRIKEAEDLMVNVAPLPPFQRASEHLGQAMNTMSTTDAHTTMSCNRLDGFLHALL